MKAPRRIAAAAIEAMRGAIDEASGDEVVFSCATDDELLINHVQSVARGNVDSAPAPLEQLRRGQVVIHNHPGGDLRPSRADVSVAAELADYGVGFYIVNNDVTDLVVVCEPSPPRSIEPLDVDALAATLDAGGALERLSDTFEPRQSQIEMLGVVARAFNDSLVAAVEAGTGVGKSYAYLVPAIAWAAANDERVVVTTATINLQQQLVEKDIPAVKRILGVDVPVALVKGRGNYLCRKRLAEAAEENSLFDEVDPELEALREWAATTQTGSRSELPFTVGEELWSRVNSDADSCTELQCRLRENCFFVRSRQQAAAAKLLVANHHLLFIDLALRVRGIGFETRAVLPPFRRLIFDEAHSIESSATSLFSEALSAAAVRKHLARLRRSRGTRKSGLLPLVERIGVPAAAIRRAESLVESVAEAADALNAAAVANVDGFTFRFTAALERDARERLLDPMRELSVRLAGLLNALQDVAEVAPEEVEGGPAYELRVLIRRLERIANLASRFLTFEEDVERVYWIDVQRRRSGLATARFTASPLDISSIMREAVFEPFASVVFTSATLTVAESFDYWSSRIGLAQCERQLIAERFPSPFPFEEHALLGIPTDAPQPGTPEFQPFVSGFLGELLVLTEGHALVLFTSYEMLRETYEAVRPRLEEIGVRVLRQGEADRARLLETFTEDSSSVLFATESFWQGVDAPGETLQVVVLCRLPFRVPSDPVLTARMEAIEARGGNAFRDLSLPEAVMKLRQGFGRLIRRSSDRGVVIVTDSRIVSRFYGRAFLDSLPRTQRSIKPAPKVLEDVERFLFG